MNKKISNLMAVLPLIKSSLPIFGCAQETTSCNIFNLHHATITVFNVNYHIASKFTYIPNLFHNTDTHSRLFFLLKSSKLSLT